MVTRVIAERAIAENVGVFRPRYRGMLLISRRRFRVSRVRKQSLRYLGRLECGKSHDSSI